MNVIKNLTLNFKCHITDRTVLFSDYRTWRRGELVFQNQTQLPVRVCVRVLYIHKGFASYTYILSGKSTALFALPYNYYYYSKNSCTSKNIWKLAHYYSIHNGSAVNVLLLWCFLYLTLTLSVVFWKHGKIGIMLERTTMKAHV